MQQVPLHQEFMLNLGKMANEGLPLGEITVLYGRNVGKSHMADAFKYRAKLIAERNRVMQDGSVESIMEQWKCSVNDCPNFIDMPITMCDSCDGKCKSDLWEALIT